jgi:RNA polymerase sigma-70 factor (ECF subfamily)
MSSVSSTGGPAPGTSPSRRSADWDWARHRSRCLAEARRLLGPTAEADDAVQEAFLRAWRHRARCRTPEAPLPWLLAITRHEALRIRSRPGATPVAEEDSAGDPDPLVESAPMRVDLLRALTELPEGDRRLLQMRYGEDLTQASVATRLGIPEGTVKVRLHRLRARLRHALTE